jgi:hypothetical protein
MSLIKTLWSLVMDNKYRFILNHSLGVMAGQQPVEDGRERPYVPAIHVFLAESSQERRGCPRQARA